MTDAVTVFVDDAVLGRLPAICVKDGVFTDDRVVQTLVVGDRGLGAAWLLLLLGPIGLIGLVVVALTGRPPEVLRVELPMSEGAHLRESAARRSYRQRVALAGLGPFGLLAGVVKPSNASPAVGLLLVLAAIGALVAGAVGSIVAHARLKAASFELDLDASRRWVTIWGVHPNFAAEAGRATQYWAHD
ncbi:MAG: hypothetical protein M3083_15240 [Actinomycetota bacterium]|nr:hypothetical protein [Actinomycetota bacterium]MDQ6947424.1 hypothetical protein [Actinomycetota bacterium]